MRATILICLVSAVALALAACGGDDEDPSPAEVPAVEEAVETGPETETVAEPEPGVEISTSDSQFGAVLFDGDDQAIYYFDVEDGPEPECYDSCAAAWPPVLTEGAPEASGEVRADLLGTTERRDGATQVTYDGRPLYYYVDEGPGEVRCHNIHHEGGLWLAVQPDGEPVPHDPAATVFLDQ